MEVQSKISDIQSLAETFSADPSDSNAEELAKQSVNTEMIFKNYFQQQGGNCEDLMKSIFGSENQRESQNMLVSEIGFFTGENFESIIRLEMCEDCQDPWINLDMRFEGRGNFNINPGNEQISMGQYRDMDEASLKTETAKILEEIKRLLESKDYDGAISSSNELRMLTQAWGES